MSHVNESCYTDIHVCVVRLVDILCVVHLVDILCVVNLVESPHLHLCDIFYSLFFSCVMYLVKLLCVCCTSSGYSLCGTFSRKTSSSFV